MGSEMTTSENYVHKIINVPVFYSALSLNDFDGRKSINRTRYQLFWTQMTLASFDTISGSKKVLNFQGPPLPKPLLLD